MSGRLVVLCGLPAAGKSSWAAAQSGAYVSDADGIRTAGHEPRRAFVRLHQRIGAAMSRKVTVVIVDTCTLQQEERERWISRARRAGYRAELVMFVVDLATCQRRDRTRAKPIDHRYDWRRSNSLLQGAYSHVEREGWDAIAWLPTRPERRPAPRV